ncbi:MAG TPA: helix-turn-helix domain-containing protein [Propionicimonas sp.]
MTAGARIEVGPDGPRLVITDVWVLRELVGLVEHTNRARIWKGQPPLEYASSIAAPGREAIDLLRVAQKQPLTAEVVPPTGAWVSTKEAAHRLGVSVQAVTKRARTGRMSARKFGGCWWIDAREL